MFVGSYGMCLIFILCWVFLGEFCDLVENILIFFKFVVLFVVFGSCFSELVLG